MKSKYKIVVRGNIHMPWQPTDEDLRIMDCYYESPTFLADTNMDIFDIFDFAYEHYCMNFKNIRIIESIELVPIC